MPACYRQQYLGASLPVLIPPYQQSRAPTGSRAIQTLRQKTTTNPDLRRKLTTHPKFNAIVGHLLHNSLHTQPFPYSATTHMITSRRSMFEITPLTVRRSPLKRNSINQKRELCYLRRLLLCLVCEIIEKPVSVSLLKNSSFNSRSPADIVGLLKYVCGG